jgi:hypothetical protein
MRRIDVAAPGSLLDIWTAIRLPCYRIPPAVTPVRTRC